jgi:large subunit ribosomal protein L7/L12
MAKLSTDDLLDAFKEMTLLELSEFVKMFEETFDVTAAAPVAVAAAARWAISPNWRKRWACVARALE